MELMGVIIRQQLIAICHRAKALPLVQPTQRPTHDAALFTKHPQQYCCNASQSTLRYLLNYSHTLYGHIMQSNRAELMSGGLMSGEQMSGGQMSGGRLSGGRLSGGLKSCVINT